MTPVNQLSGGVVCGVDMERTRQRAVNFPLAISRPLRVPLPTFDTPSATWYKNKAPSRNALDGPAATSSLTERHLLITE